MTNQELEASNAMERTQPKCPLTTADSSQEGCHCGFGTETLPNFLFGSGTFTSALELEVGWGRAPVTVGTIRAEEISP